MKLKNCLVFLFLFSFVFLSYAQELTDKDTKVKRVTKKVNKEEDALGIAEDFLKENGLAADYFLFRYLIEFKKDIWYVVFLKKEVQKEFGKVKSIRIKINRKTGEVIEHKEQEGFSIDTALR